MKVGVLTGGGDCPGLNAVIRAVVRRAITGHGWTVEGIRHGWRGMLREEIEPLDLSTVSGILPRGGTILGTSRTNPYKEPDGEAVIRRTLERRGIGALIAIGGEDTLGAAAKLAKAGLPDVGVPKTIDNDVNGTDYTFGFDTALSIATEAIDRLHTTAESHDRVMVVEVMGRHAGWIATYSGLAGGADIILVPETPFDIDEICSRIRRRHERGANFSIVVVAEGATPVEGTMELQTGALDDFGHVRLGGIGNHLAAEIEERTGFEARMTQLGHLLRGGTPSAYDRVIATRFGIEAIDAVHDGDFGVMVALRGTDVVRVPLADGVAELKTVDRRLFDTAAVFFG